MSLTYLCVSDQWDIALDHDAYLAGINTYVYTLDCVTGDPDRK